VFAVQEKLLEIAVGKMNHVLADPKEKLVNVA
jgi:hypothetical protein